MYPNLAPQPSPKPVEAWYPATALTVEENRTKMGHL